MTVPGVDALAAAIKANDAAAVARVIEEHPGLKAHIDEPNPCDSFGSTALLAAVHRQIRDHFTQYPGLRSQRDLLTSIPGIGEATAAVLIAELFDKRYGSARQAAAFAGVVPRVWESGTLRARGRLVKIGPGRLRKALYFPALAALRCNPTMLALKARLTAAGKPKMVIVGAAMRKLIHLAYGVLKSGREYEATYARS